MEPALTPTGYLKKAAECFTALRKNLYEGAQLLYHIKTEELWRGKYESFAEYLEQEVRVSESAISKLLSVYKHYCIEGGVSLRKLEVVDMEKAYLALRLPAPVDKQLASAQTLSRGELRREIQDPNDECTHQNCGTVCFDCHKRVDVNARR